MTAISVAGGRFKTPLDIANAACTHWGVGQIASFTEDSVQAQVCQERYDQLRAAELRRAVWGFSIKRAFMRPLNTPTGVSSSTSTTTTSGITGLLAAVAWGATKTYLHGSLVTYGGQVWQARTQVAANVQPDTNPTSWEQFFGTLAVSAWVVGGSATNPQLWATGTTYGVGQSVVGTDLNIYTSRTAANLANNPVTDGGVHWTLVGAAPNTGGYFAGELVYTQSGRTITVYCSLSTGNVDIPGTVPAYSATQSYETGDSVTSSSVTYQSQIDFNLGNTPVALWLVGTTYASAATVIGSDNHLYTSTGAGNVGHNPVGNLGVNWTDGGVAPWGIQPSTQDDNMTGLNWLKLGTATISAIEILYPANSGPLDQTSTRNVFLLPNGFLREAPQDPKAGSTNYLGAPGALPYNDWVYGDGYLVSTEVNPICLRFAADVQDVSKMDSMFCELLAARLALEGNERVTQSSEKESIIGAKYKQFGSEARTVNGIEQGPTEPPEDDYLTCRG